MKNKPILVKKTVQETFVLITIKQLFSYSLFRIFYFQGQQV